MLFRRREPENLKDRLRVSLWPRHSWGRSARYFLKRVMRLSASPHAIAAGVAAGVFAAATPFVGLHIILGCVIAFFIGGNLLAAALGTAVGNPLTFPFIWFGTFEVGNFILGNHRPHGGPPDLEHHAIWHSLGRLWPIIEPMTVGAVPLGLVAAGVVYFLVRSAVATYQSARRHRLALRRQHHRGASLGEVPADGMPHP
jgi:uncharacterized protein (DUF2062 family)